MKRLVTIMAMVLLLHQPSYGGWLAGWTYRKAITIDADSVAAELVNFPLLVDLSADADVVARAKSDSSDVRFTAADGVTLLTHEIDQRPSSISAAVTYGTSYADATAYLQGIASDGTYHYITAKGADYPGTIVKRAADGTLVDSTTTLTNCTQIADSYVKDGYIYVADATIVNSVNSTGARVVRFLANDLSYDSVVLNEQQANFFSEGITFFNGSWWVGSGALPGTAYAGQLRIRRFSDAWVFEKEYLLTVGLGGCQGIEFFSQNGKTYLVSSTHNYAVADTHDVHYGAVTILEYDATADVFTYKITIPPEISYAGAPADNKHDFGQGMHVLDAAAGTFLWADRPNGKIQPLTITLTDVTESPNRLFWVNVPAIDATVDTTLYVYYGRADAADASSTDAWNANYVAVWHMGDVVDATTGRAHGHRDSTAGGHHAHHYRGGARVTGQLGGGQSYDGTEAYYDGVTYNAALHPDPMTLEAWVSFGKLDKGEQALIGCTQAAGYGLAEDVIDKYVTFSVWGGGSYYRGRVSEAGLSVDTWYHIVGVYDGAASRLYCNGAEATPASYVGAITYGITNQLMFGADPDGNITPGMFFTGALDEIRLSNVARSPEWIAFAYTNMTSGGYVLGEQEGGGENLLPLLNTQTLRRRK